MSIAKGRSKIPYVRKRNGYQAHWRAERQGNLLAVAETGAHFQPEPGKRGTCEEFSDTSRRYLLKKLARVDWRRIGLSQFLTFTYPDLAWDAEYTNRTYQRSRLFAWIESQLPSKRSILWRVEWKPRQSGECRGEIAPHFHLCVFNTRYLDWQACEKEWARLLGVDYVNVDGEVSRGAGAMFYAAKYCSKVDPECGLGLASYLKLEKPGRPWGWTRQELIPWADQEEALHLEQAEIDRAMAVAKHILGREKESGFTIMDDNAGALWQFILGQSENLVDRAPRKRYRKKTKLRVGPECR